MTGCELRIGPRHLTIGRRPLLMGIVNVTPDSFSDGGAFLDPAAAVAHAERLVADGADWLDVGGESTRPGAAPVSVDEELRRVMPVIERLAERIATPLSIDTYKPAVARRAVAAGATILNDVTGFRDPEMVAVAAETNAACVVMHMRGTPTTMQDLADYDDVVADILAVWRERIDALTLAGVARERIILDPGIGFAKKSRHNLDILRRLSELTALGRPVLLGASRKRIVGELTGRPETQRLAGTIATTIAGYCRGVRLFRVHDTAAMRDALAVTQAIEEPE